MRPLRDAAASTPQIMSRPLDDLHRHRRLNQAMRFLHFFDRAERISRAVDEENRYPQVREMRRAQLLSFARRVQRVGEKQKPIANGRLFRRQHACLPAPV